MKQKIVLKNLDKNCSSEQIINSIEIFLEKQCIKAIVYSTLCSLCLSRSRILKEKKNHFTKEICSFGINDKFARNRYSKIILFKILYFLSFGFIDNLECSIQKIRTELCSELSASEICLFSKVVLKVNDRYFSFYPYDKYELDIDESKCEKLEFPKFDNPLVSIVIPCYNNFDITMNCLRAVLKNTSDISYEVIIADDKSTDDVKNIQSFAKNIKYVKNVKENGFVNNCNSGASIACGKYIFFLNNDTQVQPGYLKPLVETFNRSNNVGIVGSMLVYPNGDVQEAGGIIFRDTNAWNYGRNSKIINSAELNYEREVDYLSGAAIMIETSLFKELNGFDELYSPAYCEDSDLALRVRYYKNKSVIYQPQSKVVHFEGQSFVSEKKQLLIDKNRKSLFDRFYNYLSKNHVFDYQVSFVTRDHAVNKKQMLVIDWKILSPSFDTGSRVTFQYLSLFKKMGFNVKYYPDQVYKEKPEFLYDILNLGVEVIFEDLTSYLKSNGKYFDCVFLNRPDLAEKYIDMIRTYTKAFVIYHGHDLHYLRKFRENKLNNVANAQEIMEESKQKELSVYKKMDLSVFVSHSEMELIKKELPLSHLSTIPIFLMDPNFMDKLSYDAESRKDIAFVAGFKHSPNIDAAVWFVNEILPTVREKNPDIKVYIIGSHPDQAVLDLASENVIVTGYVTDEKLEEYYSKTRLIVVPLRFGAGVKGKVVEAIFNKVPVVTTSIGAEGIDNSSNILSIVDEAKEMAQRINSLYNDYTELNRISSMSKQFIQDHYTEEAGINAILSYIPDELNLSLNRGDF